MSAIDRFFNTLPSGVQQRLEGTYKRDGFMDPHKDSPDPKKVIYNAKRRKKRSTIVPYIPEAPKPQPPKPVERLTNREMKKRAINEEYIRLHGKGYTNVQIARARGVTESTVSKKMVELQLAPNRPVKIGARDIKIKELALAGLSKVDIVKVTGASRNFVDKSMHKTGVHEEWRKLRGLK